MITGSVRIGKNNQIAGIYRLGDIQPTSEKQIRALKPWFEALGCAIKRLIKIKNGHENKIVDGRNRYRRARKKVARQAWDKIPGGQVAMSADFPDFWIE